ncbi:hypothetical protein [Furfurilactobacillus curtus]|uniref:GNAT family N-acetyltransferase n=1 Tax=Furfurilactobacillus curtus TaxID=1746200 RepID=A0ABQ5JS91_9LACO
MKVIKYEPRYFDEIVQLYVQVFSQAPWLENFDVARVAAMLRKHVANNYFMSYLGIENQHVIAVSYGFIKPWYEGFEYTILKLKNFLLRQIINNRDSGNS